MAKNIFGQVRDDGSFSTANKFVVFSQGENITNATVNGSWSLVVPNLKTPDIIWVDSYKVQVLDERGNVKKTLYDESWENVYTSPMGEDIFIPATGFNMITINERIGSCERIFISFDIIKVFDAYTREPIPFSCDEADFTVQYSYSRVCEGKTIEEIIKCQDDDCQEICDHYDYCDYE